MKLKNLSIAVRRGSTTTTTTTTASSPVSSKSATRFPYRNNAHAIYPMEVDPKRKDHLIQVATTLCPELLSWRRQNNSTVSSSLDNNDNNNNNNKKDDELRLLPSLSSSTSEFSSTTTATDSDSNHNSTSTINSNPNDEDDAFDLLHVRPLTGGLSNELFIVENSATQFKTLVRIHPPENNNNNNHDQDDGKKKNNDTAAVVAATAAGALVDRRVVENQLVAWLSRTGDAPMFYGRFQNGRVEEFYDNHVPLTHTEMNQYAPVIAKLMSNLHAKHVPDELFSKDDKIAGGIWQRGDTWYKMAKEGLQQQQQQQQQQKQTTASSSKYTKEEIMNLLQSIHQEWKQVKATLMDEIIDCNSTNNKQPSEEGHTTSVSSRARHFCSQIVLTHMDLQSLNVLKPATAATTTTTNENKDTLKLIDYEYAGLNPRGVDIANTFMEFCDMNNLCANYSLEYPSTAIQTEFLQSYLQHEHSTMMIMTTTTDCHDHYDQHLLAKDELFLAALRHEIGRYTVVSHLAWSLWSMVQHVSSQVEFDYIAYAKHRMEGYEYFRNRFWKQQQQQQQKQQQQHSHL